MMTTISVQVMDVAVEQWISHTYMHLVSSSEELLQIPLFHLCIFYLGVKL